MSKQNFNTCWYVVNEIRIQKYYDKEKWKWKNIRTSSSKIEMHLVFDGIGVTIIYFEIHVTKSLDIVSQILYWYTLAVPNVDVKMYRNIENIYNSLCNSLILWLYSIGYAKSWISLVDQVQPKKFN